MQHPRRRARVAGARTRARQPALRFAFSTLATAAAVGATIHALITTARVRRIEDAAPAPETPIRELVHVIVPARDEAAVIDDCLRALRNQTHGRRRGAGGLHVVVVDDDSEDATAQIAGHHARNDPRVHVVHTTGPPPGWTGKVHALAVGLEACPDAAAGWVLTVDADTVLAEDAVERLLATAGAHDLDLLSTPGGPPPARSLTWPLLMPAALGLISVYASPDGRGRRAFAIGHCLLVHGTALARVGGFKALADRRGEDVALATRVRDHQGRTRLIDGLDFVTTSGMDPLAAGWRSFRKSFVAATGNRAAILAAGGLWQLLHAAVGPLLVLRGGGALARPVAFGLGLAAWGTQAVAHTHTARLMRARPTLAVLAPASLAASGVLLLDGARTVLTGTNTWKRRRQ